MTDRDESTGPEVLSSLPSRRPQRRSSRRDQGPARKPPKASGAKAKRTPAGVRPSAATRAAASAPDARPPQAPQGLELVGTAIQAAGELAQLGLTAGTRALRGVVARIPRP